LARRRVSLPTHPSHRLPTGEATEATKQAAADTAAQARDATANAAASTRDAVVGTAQAAQQAAAQTAQAANQAAGDAVQRAQDAAQPYVDKTKEVAADTKQTAQVSAEVRWCGLVLLNRVVAQVAYCWGLERFQQGGQCLQIVAYCWGLERFQQGGQCLQIVPARACRYQLAAWQT
jgi:hypothetical protein